MPPKNRPILQRQMSEESATIAQMTLMELFMDYYLSERVLRLVNILMQQLDFILNFSNIFTVFQLDDYSQLAYDFFNKTAPNCTYPGNNCFDLFKLKIFEKEKDLKKEKKYECTVISLVINCLCVLRIIAVMAKDRKAIVNGRVIVELLLVLLNIVLKSAELYDRYDDWSTTQLSLMACGFKLIIAMYELNQGEVRKLKTRIGTLEQATKKQVDLVANLA